MTTLILPLTLATLLVAQASKDSPQVQRVEDAFLDETARTLILTARQRREEIDRSLLSYTAIVRQRIAAGIRTFRKDRTIYHAEMASRVRWNRDEPIVVQVLAGRQQDPDGVKSEVLTDDFYDPSRDPIFFGLTNDEVDEDFFLEHPLMEGSEEYYRYRTGDTLRISLPDGRMVEAVEIEVLPREASFKLIAGSLWIEPSSGGLMRAVYRLSRSLDIERDMDLIREMDDDPDLDEAETNLGKVPGIFKPMEMSLRMIVVEYSLWSFKYWLPRALRAEGEARAGIIRAPASFEITYVIEDAYGEDELEERLAAGQAPSAWDVLDEWDAQGDFRLGMSRSNDRSYRVLVPQDEEVLLEGPELPPPIWEDMGPSIAEAELQEMFENLADLPEARPVLQPWSFRWGYQGRDLLRYNRVEGLSIGARVERDFGFLLGQATLRVGIADPTPDAELRITRDRLTSRQSLAVYHSLASVDERGQALQIGNSANALLLGRDDGEYFRTVGGALTWMPPADERPWWEWRLYGERQEPVRSHTDVALPGLWDSGVFRPNIQAAGATQFGTSLRLSPWWGSDRSGLQGGVEWFVHGALGDFEFLRTRATVYTVFPLSERLRAGLEVGGGTSWGEVPLQRLWYLGGSQTLRGYEGSSAVGSSFARGRVELSRGGQAVGVAVYTDWAWAGDRSAFDAEDGLWSAGIGMTTLDGLIRIDLARGLRAPTGWRVELYLDSLL
jgi:hypothetical protein